MKIPYDYSIHVTTTPFESGVIQQDVKSIARDMTRYICDTQDQQIRQALMQLGWLPPEEVHKLESKIYKLECDLIDALNSAWGVNP